MRLTVNGREIELPDGATVSTLLAALALSATRVAVERNQEIVERRSYDETALADGDLVEIVTFVGGG
jgi:sulfur carrier protein